MIDFLSANAGLIGLLFFFLFFCLMAGWTFRSGARQFYKQKANIPFEENE